jgi:putative oxygen-independent coproporphyrinogen III oxidase
MRRNHAYDEGPPTAPDHPAASREADPGSHAGRTPLGVLADASPTGRSVGVYVHVPFCTRRCEYCSFNTAPLGDRAEVTRFVEAVRREIALLARAPWAGAVRVGTVFFGGGTPSLLEPAELAALLDALRASVAVDGDAEITVECNPESVSRAKLAGYRSAGVSRISLGVQSLDDAVLAGIGRLHTAAEARAAFDAARAAGSDNVSVDLIYGLPGLTADMWRSTVDEVVAWGPEHLSAYGLTLDPGSVWGSTGVGGLPPEETVVTHYWTMVERAAAQGYEHYEISNYARAGRRSRHNQVYWRRGEYLAFGPGAAGFVGDLRYGNVKPVGRYTQLLGDGRLPIDTSERLDARQALAETLILGLRTVDGVGSSVLDERVAGDGALARRVAAWRERSLLVETAGRTRLTDAGFLLSDALFVDLL